MKSILDRDFVYVPSWDTDVRRTFERVRAEKVKTGEQVEQTCPPFPYEKLRKEKVK